MLKANSRSRAVAAAILAWFVITLAGCGSGQPADVHVRGQLALAGDDRLPNGATARISLIQHASDNTDNRIVAERTLHHLGKLPVSFNLAVGRKLLRSGSQYALNAQIMDKDGNVKWETPVPQAVKPTDQGGSAMLVLQSSTFRSAGDFQHYKCANDFRFDMAGNERQVILRMGNRQIRLDAKNIGGSASSVYADDHGDQLTLGHDKITLTMDDATHINCAVVSDRNNSRQTDKTARGESTKNH